MSNSQSQFLLQLLILPLLFLVVMWGMYWLDWNYFIELYEWGIYPRSFHGLIGIFTSPFIHGSVKHLYNNSITIFVLLIALQYFYKQQFWYVLLWGIALSGFGTWLIGRESYHIGASGLIYVLVSFIFFKGIQTRYYRLVALSLTVVVLYGGMFWYMFPDIEEGISWEGHLSGFIGGLILCYSLEVPDYHRPYKYDWQRPDYDSSNDPFMQCFDEFGNFSPPPPPPELEEQSEAVEASYFQCNYQVVYHLKEKDENES
ncbi:rhomboid family intramembrane serine protease [Flavobacterium sp. NKUCC04_CG]|uniref:rhomboid family intramembrane serine protease n=1 Tax=Flavobacterium sp. NKUCC04_CG TaxID=2842121 RepID=UPI001C5BA174|nr:rhomboid family intramembrane serine protease [Flavobacterium sp. NKUCC04_CG]MBW3517647.1 rhomboid family intramembrane serine protease [Flavobacterium sp. NKUCC04_CG]